MHSAAVHLVRRGLEVQQKAEYQLPGWGIAVLAVTAVLFVVINASIEYTFGRLVPTLVMVESPQANVVESTEPLLDDKKAHDADADSKTAVKDTEVLVVKQQFVTRTLCSTIRHLRAQGGRLARFRGFAAFGAYAFAYGMVTNGVASLGPLPRGVAPMVSALVCANLATAWTQIAISEKSAKPWYKRVPGCKAWKKVAGPTLFFAIAKHLTGAVPMYIANYWGMVDMAPEQVQALTQEERLVFAWKGFSLVLVGLVMAMLFLLPAKVTLTRVQASLLSDSEETIVPFDRSFGGRVFPEAIGGSGSVSPRDAWRSYGLDSRTTLIKTYAKVMAIEMALFVGFFVAIAGELVFIMGDDIRQFIPADGEVIFGAR